MLRLSFADCGTISIHALREEGDARMLAIGGRIAYFYPRPPRGGRPAEVAAPRGPRKISIHALREEGDCLALMQASGDKKFLSTPSARRATGRDASGGLCGSHFYPRPPRGGRPARYRVASKTTAFLSTPSARRATQPLGPCRNLPCISIHALREEGDASTSPTTSGPAHFYPRPPRGGRPGRRNVRRLVGVFLSTPSARRATLRRAKRGHVLVISIHALREEGDGLHHDQRRDHFISIHALREEGDSKNRDKISIFKQIIQHSARI